MPELSTNLAQPELKDRARAGDSAEGAQRRGGNGEKARQENLRLPRLLVESSDMTPSSGSLRFAAGRRCQKWPRFRLGIVLPHSSRSRKRRRKIHSCFGVTCRMRGHFSGNVSEQPRPLGAVGCSVWFDCFFIYAPASVNSGRKARRRWWDQNLNRVPTRIAPKTSVLHSLP
jgi:hypothetical protein